MGLITYPTTLVNNTVADADEVQGNFEAITDEVNGNLDDTNIAAGGVGTTSIADGSVTDPKIVDVDGAKIQAGTLPLSSLGFPLAGGPGNLPVGAVTAWAGSFEPAQFKLCNGQVLDKATYALLYAAIGDEYSTPAWQAANPSDFKVPDLRQRVPVGLGAAGQVNDLGLNGEVNKDTAATGTPFHDHDWTLPNHTHDIPPHSHSVGATPLQGVVTTGTPGNGTPKWRLALNTDNTVGGAGAGAFDSHSHVQQLFTGTIGGPAIGGISPDTPDTQHAHNVNLGPGSTVSTNTGTAISAATTVSMSAVAAQQTTPDKIPFLVLNYLIYTGV